MERISIDVTDDHMGAVSKLMASRKARMLEMVNHGQGRVRMEYVVPARGLIGFHNEFLIETRGTGISNHVFEGYEPWHGELRTRHTGSLVADRAGQTTGYALQSLQDRGQLFVAPGTQVYEGMMQIKWMLPGQAMSDLCKGRSRSALQAFLSEHQA